MQNDKLKLVKKYKCKRKENKKKLKMHERK